MTEFVSCRLTSVYMYLHACTVQFVCTHMDVSITMYIYILYMQVLNECHAVTEFVSCRLQSILHACTVPFVCTHMDVCITMYIYILYMQVLNECHSVTEFVSCRLTSVYMYLHACTVQFVCTHMYVCHYQKLTDARNYIPCRSDNSCALLNVWSAIGSGNIALYANKSKGTTQLPTIKKHSSVIICPVCAEVSVTLAPSIRPK